MRLHHRNNRTCIQGVMAGMPAVAAWPSYAASQSISAARWSMSYRARVAQGGWWNCLPYCFRMIVFLPMMWHSSIARSRTLHSFFPPFVRMASYGRTYWKDTQAVVYCLWSIGWPASWSSGRSFWLLITRSRVWFPALPWGFSLWGGGSPWWPWSG